MILTHLCGQCIDHLDGIGVVNWFRSDHGRDICRSSRPRSVLESS